MYADCHIHMVLDGVYYKDAIAAHRQGPREDLIRPRLEAYRSLGFTYLRDGGDRWGGLPVEGGILWCATEKASKEALDQTIAIVKEVLAQ